MKKDPFQSGRDTSFVEPFRHALNRMQEREILTPEQYTDRARRLLVERFGGSADGIGAGFSYGSAGVQADHTHYFNGFALTKTMHQGAAVAARIIEDSELRIVMEGNASIFTAPSGQAMGPTMSLAARMVQAAMSALGFPTSGGLELAIIVTIPAGFDSAYLASVAVASIRSAQMLQGVEITSENSFVVAREAVESVLDCPFSIAYVIGASVEDPDPFVLIDTETLEHLPVVSPDKEAPDWALVDTTGANILPNRNARIAMCEEIVVKLQQKGFTKLKSLRDLEHHDLETAMSVLSRRLRPALRSLVSDNRRVQRLVAAIRNGDWQLMGALLLMSHASRRDDWIGTSAIHDFVVDSAERFSLEGVYGAARAGEGTFVLVAGQPFRLPAFLDHLRKNWPDQATGGPDIIIL